MSLTTGIFGYEKLHRMAKLPPSLETVATFVRMPSAAGATTMLATAPAWLLRLPSEQITVPAIWVHVPCEAFAETKLVPAGKGSVKRMPVVPSGPRLVTVAVQVKLLLTSTGLGAADIVTPRSANACTTNGVLVPE